MKYYYNETEQSFFIATNFIPASIPEGYAEITKEQYDELTEADKPNEEEASE